AGSGIRRTVRAPWSACCCPGSRWPTGPVRHCTGSWPRRRRRVTPRRPPPSRTWPRTAAPCGGRWPRRPRRCPASARSCCPGRCGRRGRGVRTHGGCERVGVAVPTATPTRDGSQPARPRRALLVLAFLAATPALLEAVHHPGALTLRPSVDADGGAPGGAPPPGQPPQRAHQHDDETDDADRYRLKDHASQEEADAGHEAERRLDEPTLVVDLRVRLPHGVGELRVLRIQRPLDLFEHALLVFRERHGA